MTDTWQEFFKKKCPEGQRPALGPPTAGKFSVICQVDHHAALRKSIETAEFPRPYCGPGTKALDTIYGWRCPDLRPWHQKIYEHPKFTAGAVTLLWIVIGLTLWLWLRRRFQLTQ